MWYNGDESWEHSLGEEAVTKTTNCDFIHESLSYFIFNWRIIAL